MSASTPMHLPQVPVKVRAWPPIAQTQRRRVALANVLQHVQICPQTTAFEREILVVFFEHRHYSPKERKDVCSRKPCTHTITLFKTSSAFKWQLQSNDVTLQYLPETRRRPPLADLIRLLTDSCSSMDERLLEHF